MPFLLFLMPYKQYLFVAAFKWNTGTALWRKNGLWKNKHKGQQQSVTHTLCMASVEVASIVFSETIFVSVDRRFLIHWNYH